MSRRVDHQERMARARLSLEACPWGTRSASASSGPSRASCWSTAGRRRRRGAGPTTRPGAVGRGGPRPARHDRSGRPGRGVRAALRGRAAPGLRRGRARLPLRLRQGRTLAGGLPGGLRRAGLARQRRRHARRAAGSLLAYEERSGRPSASSAIATRPARSWVGSSCSRRGRLVCPRRGAMPGSRYRRSAATGRPRERSCEQARSREQVGAQHDDELMGARRPSAASRTRSWRVGRRRAHVSRWAWCS